MLWTLVEPGVAITAASLITIRPLLRALHFKGFSNSTTPSSDYVATHSRRNVSANHRLENWNNLSSVTGPKTPPKGAREHVSETASEEYILEGSLEDGNRVGERQEQGTIMQTRTVTVVVDRDSRAASRRPE